MIAEAARIEEVGVNAVQTQRQLFAHPPMNQGNGAALAVYRQFGFTTPYAYHYRARPHECR